MNNYKMKYLIGLAMLLNTLQSCSLGMDYKYPTVQESYDLCETVIVGRVDNPPEPDVLDNKVIYLKETEYYKGCGPEVVKITGYSSGSSCGIYPPRTGQRVMVFVCENKEKNGYILHRFAPYAGQMAFNRRHFKELRKISHVNPICNPMVSSGAKCRRRET